MLVEYFTPLHVAFLVVGAGLGVAAGTWCRNHLLMNGGPALGALVGGSAFWYAAFHLRLLLLLAACGGLLYLAWRQRADWSPAAIRVVCHLAKPLIARFHRPPSVNQQLVSEQDRFDDATEAILSQPLPPNVKQGVLEDLERRHNTRIRQLFDDGQAGGDPHAT